MIEWIDDGEGASERWCGDGAVGRWGEGRRDGVAVR